MRPWNKPSLVRVALLAGVVPGLLIAPSAQAARPASAPAASAQAARAGAGAARDVYVPPVTYPRRGTVWYTGRKYSVRWDASHPPARISNRSGRIMLRHAGRTLDPALAEGFDIRAGRAEVTVPDVPPGRYRIVLFGDSGNFSPEFVITRGNRPAGASGPQGVSAQ
ncbi:hypothetical protein ACFQ7O_18325 [Streptomyces sp. NPDC056485]|uniref:hypothetical protein n=1 Tax=Streptomyces sp. NPDC056485 TaxID=3345834 RepID=UPI00367A42FB